MFDLFLYCFLYLPIYYIYNYMASMSTMTSCNCHSVFVKYIDTVMFPICYMFKLKPIYGESLDFNNIQCHL